MGEFTYVPSPLVWSRLKALDHVVDVVVGKIRPQDIITYHKWTTSSRSAQKRYSRVDQSITDVTSIPKVRSIPCRQVLGGNERTLGISRTGL